ncbi:MAG: peptidyl-prolyl cis-trans isomerase [Spirochaetaceae bacterium]|nr:peptidyl-prolyl cis-trans isomerase [Spirochaetaceae bacterium]
MKKIFSLVLLLLLASGSIFAQSTANDLLDLASVSYSSPANIKGKDYRLAIEQLIKSQLMQTASSLPSKSELDNAFKQFYNQVTKAQKQQIIEQLIDNKLLVQAAQTAKDASGKPISVTENEVDKAFNEQKSQLTIQLKGPGGTMSDSEFVSTVSTYFGYPNTIKEIKDSMRDTLWITKFLNEKVGNASQVTEPSNAEIEFQYRLGRQNFSLPEIISYRFIPFTTGRKDDSKRSADNAKKDIGNSKDSFDKEWQKDARNANTFPVSSQYANALSQEYGRKFIEELLSLSLNTPSPVIEGPKGYYILLVTGRTEPKFLSLNDQNPDNQTRQRYPTVRDLAKAQITQQRLMESQAQKQSEIVADLKKQAKIIRNEANINKVIGT